MVVQGLALQLWHMTILLHIVREPPILPLILLEARTFIALRWLQIVLSELVHHLIEVDV